MPRTESHWLDAPSLGGQAEVVVHGHWGRPVIWFPSEGGSPWDFADHGMLEALAGPIDAGLIKMFCVSSHDSQSWSAGWKPQGDRARAHQAYEDWIVWQVVPFVRDTSGGRDDLVTAGPSMGAFHAVLFALRHAHLFRRVVALSGNYEPWQWRAWGQPDQSTYLTDPLASLAGAQNGHLEHLRRSLFLTLVVGSGQWEDTTGAHESTRRLAGLLTDKQIPHELHIWGSEWPHDWPSWQAQARIYLPQLA